MPTSGAVASGTPINKTASANIVPRTCELIGFYVNSTTSGTLILYDDASTGTTTAISGTITPAIGYHAYPATLRNGLNAVIASTLNVTFFVV